VAGRFGDRALQALAARPGERVLDIGCGFGDTTLQLAQLVGPAGMVVGVDISRPMLALARRVVSERRATNVELREADAQTAVLGAAAFDAGFSRFGVMFFADPLTAFANIRGALRPDGRIAFAVWQDPSRNPWMILPIMAAAPHIGMPDLPPPNEPGPFSLADPNRVRSILEGAGFRDVVLQPYEPEITVPNVDDPKGAGQILMEVGPLATLFEQAEPAQRQAALEAVAEQLAPFASASCVAIPSASWIVTARSP
jgi:SAM-dependent methyltransferase